MATDTPSGLHDQTEHCEACGRDTQHSVSVEIRTESGKAENAEFSREPYRVTTCVACGSERSQRMNNA
jgi:ribosomal protein L37E